MLTNFQVDLLKRIAPRSREGEAAAVYRRNSSLSELLGEDFFRRIKGKVVIDFGCGTGADAIEIARAGARHVIGIDILENYLKIARENAAEAGVQDICTFTTSTNELADVVISVDAFEHFEDPADILCRMNALLQPDAEVNISFGPTWYHPLGGHLFSVFPWAHLVFNEEALLRWRATFKSDGARRFRDVAGGLNQMTIARFERLVAASPLSLASLELVPIKKLRPLHNRWTREFTTAIVRCRLKKRKASR